MILTCSIHTTAKINQNSIQFLYKLTASPADIRNVCWIVYFDFRQLWMCSQRRSQFEHDHRQRADLAPRIRSSFTRNRRRAHWQILWGKRRPERIGAQILTKAPCACRPEGSLSTGLSHSLVKPSLSLCLEYNWGFIIISIPKHSKLNFQSGMRNICTIIENSLHLLVDRKHSHVNHHQRNRVHSL